MRKIFLAVIFIAVTHTIIAQKISWGMKAGANITNFTGGDFQNVNKKALIGFHAGLFLNFNFGLLSLQPEVLVSTAGAKFENADSSFRLTYLSVPVMLKFRTPGGFYFEIGPQVGFKLSENISNQTVKDFAKNLDLTAAGGLGFQTKGGLGLGARYLAGLSKVGNFIATSSADPDFKNSIFQIGISIPFGK
jgi:Outer membrane protein beta-barrel domain